MKELGYYDESFNATLQSSDGDLSSYSFHMADQGTDAMEREKQFLFASQEGRYLWHVNEALRRLYGTPEKFGALPPVRPGDRLRAARRAAARAALHHVQGERRRWQAPLSPAPLVSLVFGGRGHRGRLDLVTKIIAEATLLRTPGVAGAGRLVPVAPGLQPGRRVRAAPRDRTRAGSSSPSRSSRCSCCTGCRAAAPPGDRFRQLALRPGGRRRGRQPDRPDPQRPRAWWTSSTSASARCRWPTFNVADIAVSCGAHRARDLVLARGLARPQPEPAVGGRDVSQRRHASPSLADATERLDRFLADQLGLSRTQAARLVADKARDAWMARPARASRAARRAASASTVEFPDDEPPRTLTPAAIPLTRRVRGRAPRRDRQAGRPRRPSGAGPLGRHAGERARGARHDAGRRGRGPARHRAPARPRHLGAHGGRQDRPGAPAARRRDRARRVRRTYAALAWGHLDASPTVIEAPIARHPTRPEADGGAAPTGRPARTDAYVVARFGVGDLLRLELHTGRTHQIRVHLEHIGHPVVGDPVYAGGGSRRISGAARARPTRLERATPRQALHAAALAFRHPVTGRAARIPGRMAGRSAAMHLLAAGCAKICCSPQTPCAIFVSSIEMANVRLRCTPSCFASVRLVCAAPAGIVREILPRLPATRIPGVAEAVEGLVNVRGTLVTVVDGHVLLASRTGRVDDEGAIVVAGSRRARPLRACGRQVLDFLEVPERRDR